jgi:hypothetical protein
MNNLKNFLIVIIFVAFTLVGIVIFVDPGHVYSDKKEEVEIAKKLIEGFNVSNFGNLDERIIQKSFIENQTTLAEVGILGSSRVMQLMTSHKNVQNYAVPNAVMQDYFSTVQLLDENKKLPSRIFIEISPWLFNKNNTVSYWKSWTFQYEKMRVILGLNRSIFLFGDIELVKNLFSPSYFQASLKSFVKNGIINSKRHNLSITKFISQDSNTKVSTGHLFYGKEYALRPQNIIEIDARKYAENIPLDMLTNFDEIDKDFSEDLKQLFNFLEKKGVEVTLLLLPYHPTSYQIINKRTDTYSLSKIEQYIMEEFEEFEIYGSYDPTFLNYKDKDFYDSLHLKLAKVDDILKFKRN